MAARTPQATVSMFELDTSIPKGKPMTEQRFSICQFTTPDTTFEEDLALYRSVGASGIGIIEEKLRPGQDAELLAAFEASGLTATVCLPTNVAVLPVRPPLAYGGPEDTEERIELMCNSIRRLAPFRPDCIVVGTGSEVGYSADEARSIAIDGLRRAAAVAADCGTRLALEPCRRELGFDANFLDGLQSTVDLIDEIGAQNVGVCYDVYHHWDEDDILTVTQAHAQRVFGVQLNDWREPPRSNADRLLPGDGSIDVPALIAALERGGYEGWYDLEIFSDDGRWGTALPDSLWNLPAAEVAQRGMDAVRRVWLAAGQSATA